MTNRVALLNKQIQKALASAIKGIYLADSSDYETFLWEIVDELGGPGVAKLLEDDPTECYLKYVDKLEE